MFLSGEIAVFPTLPGGVMLEFDWRGWDYPNVANNLYPIVGKSPISQDLVSIFDCRSDSPQVRLNSTAIPTIRSLK